MKFNKDSIYDKQCKQAYQLIGKQKLTLRQAASEMGCSHSTVLRRIKLLKEEHPLMHCRVRYVLDYNKKYKFKQRKYWDN